MKRIENWIELVNNKIKQYEGVCLSNDCYRAIHKLEFICKRGHKFINSASNIVHNDQWCRKCAILLDGISIANKIAKIRNGKCLSNKYSGNKQHLQWECKNKHKWSATLYSIKNKKSWCPECAKIIRSEKQRLAGGLKIAQEIANKNKGKCLSINFTNVMDNLQWECKNKHIWLASLNSVKDNNHWCRECGYLEAAKKSNNSFRFNNWKTGKEIITIASYEKRTVEYLNDNRIEYEWQSKVFKMPNKKTYRPDLYLIKEDKWIEIKGYFRDDAEEKWNWFHKRHPNSELWNKEKLKEMGIL